MYIKTQSPYILNGCVHVGLYKPTALPMTVTL